MDKSTVSMVIFNSYVSLPEGMMNYDELSWIMVIDGLMIYDHYSELL